MEIEPSGLGRIEPQELARAVGPDRDLAEHAAALIACASLSDGRIDPGRLRKVVEYAHAMHIRAGWVRDVLQVARGHLAWAMADMTRRNRSTFPGWASPDDTLTEMMPYRAQTDEDKRLAAGFLALEGLPKGTFGHQFWAHFRRHGFGFPGETEAFTGLFAVPHDGLHVLSGYSTSIQGELLVSTFTGAMHRRDALHAHICGPRGQRHRRAPRSAGPGQVLGQLAARGFDDHRCAGAELGLLVGRGCRTRRTTSQVRHCSVAAGRRRGGCRGHRGG